MLDFSKRKTCVGQNYQALGIISLFTLCRKLSAGSFLSGLQRIYIGSNQIEEIAPNTFHHLQNIRCPPLPFFTVQGKPVLQDRIRSDPHQFAGWAGPDPHRLAGFDAGCDLLDIEL